MRGSNRQPNLFLVGAPKCGTTAMSKFLASHSDIYMSEEAAESINSNDIANTKEPAYYAYDIENLFGKRKFSTYEQYVSIFNQIKGEYSYIGEASPQYLSSKVAISEIMEDCPDAKIIVCIRNPIKMAQSLHGHRVKNFEENILDFEKAWRAEGKRMRGDLALPSQDKTPAAYQYSELAKIGSQLERLLEAVPRDQVHVVVQGDMMESPLSTYKGVVAFLGLEDDSEKSFSRLNPSKVIKRKKMAQFILLLKRLRKASRIPSLGTGVLKKMYSLTLAEEKQDLRPEFKVELRDYYKDEIEKLSHLINRDLSTWLH